MRLAPAEPPYDDHVREDFARLMPPGMDPILLFRTLAHNPRVLRRIRRGGLLDPGSISVRQRELVILRVTARCRAEYEWGVHVVFFGAAAGMGAAEQHAVVHLSADAGCWSEDEALLVRMCDELHDTATLTDGTWEALAARFRDEQVVELVVLAGLYRAISQVVRGLGVPLEPGAPRFPSQDLV